jgi:hypothetical protein
VANLQFRLAHDNGQTPFRDQLDAPDEFFVVELIELSGRVAIGEALPTNDESILAEVEGSTGLAFLGR